MRILIIGTNLVRAGFRQRIGVYFDILSQNGIDCEIVKLPQGTLARHRLFKRAVDFDGVLLHKKGLNFFDAPQLRRYAKKIIYHFDDAVMYRDKSPERYSRAHFKPFCRTVKLADMIIASSSYLAQIAMKFNKNVKVLPTGLNVADYHIENIAKDDGKIRLVWIGSSSTLGYLAQIKAALEQIGSRYNNVILRIIGDDFFDLRNMAVEKFKWDKDKRYAYLGECDIGLAPLPDDRFAQGKCCFKVMEYAAAALPVVASPVGTNIDNIDNNVTGLLAQNDQQWFENISRLIEDRQLRDKMGKQACLYADDLDISVIGPQLAELIKNCLSN